MGALCDNTLTNHRTAPGRGRGSGGGAAAAGRLHVRGGRECGRCEQRYGHVQHGAARRGHTYVEMMTPPYDGCAPPLRAEDEPSRGVLAPGSSRRARAHTTAAAGTLANKHERTHSHGATVFALMHKTYFGFLQSQRRSYFHNRDESA